jgi:hypothetical protein
MVLGIVSGLFLVLLFHLLIHLVHGNGALAMGVMLSLMAIAGMAIAGGALALVRPAVGGTLMLVSGIGSFIGYPGILLLVYNIPGLLLIIRGVLSFAAGKKLPAVRVVAMVLGIIGGLIGAFGVDSGMPGS